MRFPLCPADAFFKYTFALTMPNQSALPANNYQSCKEKVWGRPKISNIPVYREIVATPQIPKIPIL